MIVGLLALLPILGMAGSLVLGWLATTQMVYTTDSATPSWLLRACATTDRILLGQAIIFSGLAGRLMALREFTCGLMNLSVNERPSEQRGMSAASRSMAMGLMGQAMRIMTTANRVQSRMYGHVAREIALQHGPLARKETTTSATATASTTVATATATTTAAALLPNSFGAASPPVRCYPLGVPSAVAPPAARIDDGDDDDDDDSRAPWETKESDPAAGTVQAQGGDGELELGKGAQEPRPDASLSVASTEFDVDGFLACRETGLRSK